MASIGLTCGRVISRVLGLKRGASVTPTEGWALCLGVQGRLGTR